MCSIYFHSTTVNKVERPASNNGLKWTIGRICFETIVKISQTIEKWGLFVFKSTHGRRDDVFALFSTHAPIFLRTAVDGHLRGCGVMYDVNKGFLDADALVKYIGQRGAVI